MNVQPFVSFTCRMDSVAKALEEVLTSALPQGCITVGVYEAAKSLNVYVQADIAKIQTCWQLRETSHTDCNLYVHVCLTPLLGLRPCFLFPFSETLIMWFCAYWPLMTKMWKMWPCRSTLPSFRHSAVRMTSTSWESTTPGAWQKYWVEVENRVGVNLWTFTVSWSL